MTTTSESRFIVSLALAALWAGAALSGCGQASGAAPSTGLSQVQTPLHPTAEPWTFADSPLTTGQGPCAVKTVDAIAAEIRAGFADVQSIVMFRPLGPLAPALDAGPATMAGQPPPPATMRDSSFSALLDDRSIGMVFYQGSTCLGQNCAVQDYWYFETANNCSPTWVGQYHQSRLDTCYDTSGTSLWNAPSGLDPRALCNADWSARPLPARTLGSVLGAGMSTCGGATMNFAKAEVDIVQSPDLNSASVVIHGTGIPALDGQTFMGLVKRQRLEIATTVDLPGACAATRKFKITVDFEGTSNFPVPGAFAGIDVVDTLSAGCVRTDATCAAYLFILGPQ